MADFSIDIPISVNGGGGGSDKTNNTLKELNDNVKKLDKSVFGTLDIFEMLTQVLGDIFKLIQPLFKLLSIILLIFYIPFIPLIKILAGYLANVAKGLSKFMQGEIDFSTLVEEYIQPGLIQLLEGFLNWWEQTGKPLMESIFSGVADWILKNILPFLWSVILILGEFIIGELWEKIVGYWEIFTQVVMWIWENILQPAWNWFLGIGEKLWTEILKPAWDWFSDIGEKIWAILKSGFDYVQDKLYSLSFGLIGKKSEDDFIIRPNGQLIETADTDFLIGTKNPDKLFGGGGGGSITININNPSVRDDSDIRKLANAVSRELQLQSKRRAS